MSNTACAAIAAVILIGWWAYSAGYKKAESEGRTALVELQSTYNLAFAVETARITERIQEQTRRALSATQQLEQERTHHAKEQAALRSRIAAVTRNSRHVFSVEFVRLWNQAVGATSAGGHTVPAPGSTPGPDGNTGAGQTSGTGILGGVTEADVLAWITYYGERTRNLETQIRAWITIAEGWQQ